MSIDVLNKKQKIAMWVGIVAAILAGLFPPWSGGNAINYHSYGYSPIWQPYAFRRAVIAPKPNFGIPSLQDIAQAAFGNGKKTSAQTADDFEVVTADFVDPLRLVIEWLLIAAATKAAIVSFRRDDK